MARASQDSREPLYFLNRLLINPNPLETVGIPDSGGKRKAVSPLKTGIWDPGHSPSSLLLPSYLPVPSLRAGSLSGPQLGPFPTWNHPVVRQSKVYFSVVA
jgi:hypothetical protein